MSKTFVECARTCVILLALVASGCSTPSVPTTPAHADENTDYIIGPGDTLQIFVWRNPDLSTTVPVRPDGRISIPLVQDMQAVGKTPTQLGHDLEERLSTYIRSPSVTVIVTNFVGTFAKQIRVIGQATKPQALPYRENMTLLDVMISVGGLTQYAAGNRAKVVRRIGGKEIEIPVRLDDLINSGDISANIKMLPGDIVIIPESWF